MFRAAAFALLVLAAPAAAAPNTVDDPGLVQHGPAMEVVRLRAFLIACPRVAAGPKAKGVWRGLLASYLVEPPDIPALKVWIAKRTDQYLRETPTPSGGWCAEAKFRYGRAGMRRPDAIVMRDGSDSTPKCIYDGSCGAQNTVDVYLY